MKIKNIAAIPFTLLADVVTLGNMGGTSYTQQLMNKDTSEQNNEEILKLIKALSRSE